MAIKFSRSHETEMAHSYFIGMLLAFSGGFIDAYTYLTRDEVFAYAQTGNIVLMSINLGKTNYLRALLYLIPIITFILGVFTALWLRKKFSAHGRLWRQIVVLLESVIVTAVCFIPYGKYTNAAAIVLISLVSALQYEAFNRLRGQSFASTMCTGNLRSGSESLYLYFATKDKTYRNKAIFYFGIISVFILGAVIGTVITHFLGFKAALFSVLFLLAAFISLFFDKSII